MPKFMTYQRPAPVNTRGPKGKPGIPYGRVPGRKPPKLTPDTLTPSLPETRLPGFVPPKR